MADTSLEVRRVTNIVKMCPLSGTVNASEAAVCTHPSWRQTVPPGNKLVKCLLRRLILSPCVGF